MKEKNRVAKRVVFGFVFFFDWILCTFGIGQTKFQMEIIQNGFFFYTKLQIKILFMYNFLSQHASDFILRK